MKKVILAALLLSGCTAIQRPISIDEPKPITVTADINMKNLSNPSCSEAYAETAQYFRREGIALFLSESGFPVECEDRPFWRYLLGAAGWADLDEEHAKVYVGFNSTENVKLLIHELTHGVWKCWHTLTGIMVPLVELFSVQSELSDSSLECIYNYPGSTYTRKETV